jgi:hypothetical protein
MDTDGSKDSITLANKELIYQVGQILNIFGVKVAINNNRRKPRFSKFISNYVTYHEIKYTQLPDACMPLFAKRSAFLDFRKKQNEQFRYPDVLVKTFGAYIKHKYEIANGYWNLGTEKKTHCNIKYSKDLWGSGQKSKESWVYGHKIDYFVTLAKQLHEYEWADRLSFARRGYYEQVKSIEHGNYYFYDLEVQDDHAYWSNGFISHNTLAMAVAELSVLLHDGRDAVHVGAILNQAQRCFEYQTKFLLNDKLKGIVQPKDVPEQDRILIKNNREKSIFNVNGKKSTIEILPCTLKAVNGPHVPLVVVDEIDTVDGEGLKAFKDISGMLDSRGTQIALRVGISTRKTRYGLMNTQIESAEKAGRTIKKWTAFEFSQRCPDERSGTDSANFYINQNDMETITPEEYVKKPKNHQDK